MTTLSLRGMIKKSIDRLPPDRLETLADFVAYLSRPDLKQRLKLAEREFKAGKGTNWRAVRRDV